MPRARDLGIGIGTLPTGPTNSVLDVAGVGLGHTTVTRETARTGVTSLVLAEDAYLRPLVAGGAVLNGMGECTGFVTIRETGMLETPVWLTSTMQLGRVYDAACELELGRHPQVADDVCIPVVGECDDSFLNDCRRMWVTADDVRAAHAAALASRGSSGPPDEGSVGSGTGMSCLGFKGGIGTSSRVTPEGHTVAVLLMTNFGVRERLTVDGVPVGQLLDGWHGPEGHVERPAGSCIGVAVTDAPVDPAGCERLARRIGLGLARTGSVAHHGSGEIFLAASTAARTDRDGAQVDSGPRLGGRQLDELFGAVVDAAEEAVLNSMLMSPTTVGRDGNTSEGLDPDVVRRLVEEHRGRR
ncbi:P1 family peptidase [Nocardioides sp.]|uniref:P1 family peptidase n=1 Tax=Nocardioides sp. TaxID=35761 RepID=UPI001A25A217|nr:P1 family peptidase [Nocardioides sp.]MBJ7356401.1 P1 family peptidase [Nocardioides sp.]